MYLRGNQVLEAQETLTRSQNKAGKKSGPTIDLQIAKGLLQVNFSVSFITFHFSSQPVLNISGPTQTCPVSLLNYSVEEQS